MIELALTAEDHWFTRLAEGSDVEDSLVIRVEPQVIKRLQMRKGGLHMATNDNEAGGGGGGVRPVKFEGFNCIYKGGDGVEDMPAKREGGNVTSRWWPSQDEINVLVRGGSVEMVIAGGQPPVSLGVAPP